MELRHLLRMHLETTHSRSNLGEGSVVYEQGSGGSGRIPALCFGFPLAQQWWWWNSPFLLCFVIKRRNRVLLLPQMMSCLRRTLRRRRVLRLWAEDQGQEQSWRHSPERVPVSCSGHEAQGGTGVLATIRGQLNLLAHPRGISAEVVQAVQTGFSWWYVKYSGNSFL